MRISYILIREANKIANCLVKKGIDILDSRILWSNYPKNVIYYVVVLYSQVTYLF